MLSNDRFLFISAHPDDTELSAGGLVHFLSRHGKTVKILILSNPSISLPSGYTNNTLIDEQNAASAELKIDPRNLIFMDFPVRRFSETRQDILEELVALRKDYNPQFVFTSHPDDTHQDHSQIGQEARRAFAKTNLLYFEAPWNGSRFLGNYTVPIEKQDIEAKIRSIACFRSQQHRVYSSEDFVRGLARMRGAAINEDMAEAFEVSHLRI